MNTQILAKHIKNYQQWIKSNAEEYQEIRKEYKERTSYYQKWTAERLRNASQEDLYEYFVKLWALRSWGNKEYVFNKLIEDNTLDGLRKSLANVLGGNDSLDKRWDSFRKKIKGVGPSIISELLCYIHPKAYAVWNTMSYNALNYLGVPDVPRHYYQLTGEKYLELCTICQKIAGAMKDAGFECSDLLYVNFFIWQELRNAETPEFSTSVRNEKYSEKATKEKAEFIHNEIRDKLLAIGTWLGFAGKTEHKVADGARVDTAWEAQIGNMGRVVYVFEVQTKGSIDSLCMNLLKSLNNPAVQGIVAVSDKDQLEKIKKQAASVAALREKLKYWDYEEVLRVHDALELVNDSINSLKLVPESFFK